MQSIRTISGLQNKFTEISHDVHDGSESAISVRDGSADTTSMGMKTFRSLEFDSEVYRKLKEAELETDTRYTPEEALASVRQIIATA